MQHPHAIVVNLLEKVETFIFQVTDWPGWLYKASTPPFKK